MLDKQWQHKGGLRLTPSGLEGTTRAGGTLSRRRFSRLLGVAAVEHLGIRVSAVAWVTDQVKVQVDQPDGEGVVFSILRAEQGRPCYLAQGSLMVHYQGPTVHPTLARAVRTVAPKALARLSLEDLAALIASDPDAGRPLEPLPTGSKAEQQAYEEGALLATWGSPAVWTSFFAGAEIARSQLDSLDFFDGCTFVQHGDHECLYVNPQMGVPLTPVVLYPWDNRLRQRDWGHGAWRPSRRSENAPGMVTTGLTEHDVIMGHGPQRLAQALDSLRHQPLGDMVFCSSTCVPVVAGEDVSAVVDRFRDEFPVPLLHLTTTPQSMQGVFRDLLVRRRREAEARRGAVDPHRINLIGFPLEPALLELRELLSRLGLTVNVALLPALSPEAIDQLPQAALHVLHPNELWRGHYDQLLFDSVMDAISPPAPFGRRGTLDWLSAVATAAGVPRSLDEIQEVVRDRWEQEDASWARQVAEASQHRLAFVVRDRDLRLLLDPAHAWGIPLLAACQEMGFSAVVLLQTAPGRDGLAGAGRQAQESLQAVWGSPEGLEVATFSGRRELRDQLREARISAVYSEHFYDRRLAESGCASFSGQVFERGLAGASRTLRRFLDLCRLPFFRRYGRYLNAGSKERFLSDPWGLEHESTTPEE